MVSSDDGAKVSAIAGCRDEGINCCGVPSRRAGNPSDKAAAGLRRDLARARKAGLI
jgi:hypothetical protein